MQSRYNTLELYPTHDFPIINTLEISIYDAQPSLLLLLILIVKMSEMEQNHETLLSRQPLGMNLALESTAEYNVSQTLGEQHQKILPAQQALEIRSKPWPETQLKVPTNKPRAPTTRASWVNTLWADIRPTSALLCYLKRPL